jgi:glycolate oxidase
MDRESVMTAQAYVQEYLLDNSRVYSPAYLLIELDGHYPEILSKEMHLIAAILNTMQAIDYEIVEDTSRQEALWSIRRKAGYALRQKTVCKELDTVVPFALLPVLVEGLKEIGQKYGLQTVTFGHAGDGNLHVHLLQNKLPVEVWKERKELATEAVFRLVVDLGGTLSAEHGVGYVHRGFMPLIFSAVHLDLFKQLKHTFDPKSIMNPRKIIQQ